MSLSQLLGNEQLKRNLQTSLQKGRVSHFYLISGPDGSGKKTLARLLAAAILCRSETKPCMQCNACRKVMSDTHPDFITVTDPEHKYIPPAGYNKAAVHSGNCGSGNSPLHPALRHGSG